MPLGCFQHQRSTLFEFALNGPGYYRRLNNNQYHSLGSFIYFNYIVEPKTLILFTRPVCYTTRLAEANVASARRRVEALRLLLQAGAEKDVADNSWRTGLMNVEPL